MNNPIKPIDDNSYQNRRRTDQSFLTRLGNGLRGWQERRQLKRKDRQLNRVAGYLDLTPHQTHELCSLLEELQSFNKASIKTQAHDIVTAVDADHFDLEAARSIAATTIVDMQQTVDQGLVAFAAWLKTLNTDQRRQLKQLLQRRFRFTAV